MTAASTAEVGKATCLASDQVGRARAATAVARDSTAAIPAYTAPGRAPLRALPAGDARRPPADEERGRGAPGEGSSGAAAARRCRHTTSSVDRPHEDERRAPPAPGRAAAPPSPPARPRPEARIPTGRGCRPDAAAARSAPSSERGRYQSRLSLTTVSRIPAVWVTSLPIHQGAMSAAKSARPAGSRSARHQPGRRNTKPHATATASGQQGGRHPWPRMRRPSLPRSRATRGRYGPRPSARAWPPPP